MGWIILIGIFIGVPVVSAIFGVNKDEIANEIEIEKDLRR